MIENYVKINHMIALVFFSSSIKKCDKFLLLSTVSGLRINSLPILLSTLTANSIKNMRITRENVLYLVLLQLIKTYFFVTNKPPLKV